MVHHPGNMRVIHDTTQSSEGAVSGFLDLEYLICDLECMTEVLERLTENIKDNDGLIWLSTALSHKVHDLQKEWSTSVDKTFLEAEKSG